MLNAFLLNTLMVSFSERPSYISELVNSEVQYLDGAGLFQLKIAANDPCLRKIYAQLWEDCFLSNQEKFGLAIQWMNCMRKIGGRHTVSENVSELDDYVYSSEFSLYLYRVESLCFLMNRRHQGNLDVGWTDRQDQLLLNIQQTKKVLVDIGENGVHRFQVPVPGVNLPSYSDLSLLFRSWSMPGTACVSVLLVFRFIAHKG